MTILGLVLLVSGTLIMIPACRANPWCQPQIQLWNGQAPVTWGVYSVVRHPHYLGALLWWAGLALVLWAPLALLWPFGLWFYIERIFREEEMLVKGLAGYPEYMKSTPYRLIPGIF